MPAWPDLFTALVAGQDLTPEQARWAMGRLLDGDATSAQIGALLLGLRAKGETPAEIGELVAATLERAVRIEVPAVAVDTCGTGGDRSGSVNISTMAAVVVAGAGVPVVKHGNRAASSKTGSADVLEALGVVINLPPEAIAPCVERAGIAFCLAPVFHPALRHVGPARGELGVGTVFNVLGPLVNPAAPAAQVVGVANPTMAQVVARVLADRGTRALVVRGEDGLDELTTTTRTRVWDATGDGVVETTVDPAVLGIALVAPAALAGGDPAYNADVARRVLEGERSAALDPPRDAVLLNAAAALVAHDAALGTVSPGSLEQRLVPALERARDAIDSGAAGAALERWVRVSRELAG